MRGTWPLGCLRFQLAVFGLLGGAEGNQFVEKRHLSPVPGEGGL